MENLLDVSKGSGRPCGVYCFVCTCQNLLRVVEAGRLLLPEQRDPTPEEQEVMNRVFLEGLSDEPLIPGMK